MKHLFLAILLFSCIGTSAQKRKGMPDHLKLQYAGAIGFLSAGAGYEVGAKKKTELDLFYGYVPKSIGGVVIHILNVKYTWKPIVKTYEKDITVNFLSAGANLSYTMGRQYHLFSKTDYSFNYYGFPTAGALGIFVGGSVTKSRLGAYYELGITDRDAMSLATNLKSLSIFDVLNIGVGVKYALKH